jgi:hypothetical protein
MVKVAPKDPRPRTIVVKQYMRETIRRLAATTGHEDVQAMFDAMSTSKLQTFVDNAEKSSSWKEAAFWAIAGWYAENDEDVKAKKFKDLSFALSEKRQADENLGEQTEKEKENYVSTAELTLLRDNYKAYKTETEMWIYLILCFITMQPVLRTSTYSSLVVAKTAKDVKDDDTNYLYYSKSGKWSGYIYINDDKVSNTLSHKDNKKIPIIDPELLKIIDASIVAYPRPNNKIFEINIVKKDDKMLALLRKATKTIGKPMFNFDMARSAYINSLPANSSRAVRTELAKNMRHTVETQDRNYRKNLDGADNVKEQSDAKDKVIADQAKKIAELTKLLAESNKYKQEWDARRNDVIRKANTETTKLKDSTIERYDIVKKNGKYE